MIASETAAPAPRAPRWRKILLGTVLAIFGVVTLLVLALGAFPVGMMRGLVESRISSAWGSPVRVGAVTRDSIFSYTPVISVRDVHIAQPDWVGPGDFVRLSSASVRVPVFALLFGHFQPDRVTIDGGRIALVRDATGRANWKREGKQGDGQGGRPTLSDLTVTNPQLVLRDAKRQLVRLVYPTDPADH